MFDSRFAQIFYELQIFVSSMFVRAICEHNRGYDVENVV